MLGGLILMIGNVRKKRHNLIIGIAIVIGLITAFSMCARKMSEVNATESDSTRGGGYAATGRLRGVGFTSKLYDATNGMPTSEANYILGSTDGYVWIASYSGIIRYDGTVFERMPSTNGLTNGRVLFEDSRKRIWVGTNDNGVVVMDGYDCVRFEKGEGLASSSIRTFAEDSDGNIYIGSTAGVSYVDRDMNIHVVDDQRINTERILKLVSDVDGNIYGQSKNGIIFSLKKGKVEKYYTSGSLNMEKITTIVAAPDESGKVYFGTEKNYIYYGEFGDKADELKKIYISPMENVKWMSYDCDSIWIASETAIGYLDSSNNFKVFENLPMNDSIEMMTSDYQGNMWFASSRQGIMKIVTNNFQNYTFLAGVPEEIVNVTCVHNNKLYVGTDSGLYIIGTEHTSFNNKLTDYLNGARIRCMTNDSSNNLWISSYTKNLGLVKYSSKGDITAFTTSDGMPSNEVRCTCDTKNGEIIAGTNAGIAVIRDDKVVRKIGKNEGMDNTVVLTVCETDDGKIYAGTDGDGIYIIDGDNIEKVGIENGLTSDVIMKIKKDEYHDLYWVITSNSIEYMKDGNIKNIESFPYNNNFDIVPGDRDLIWVLSSQGLYSVNYDDMLNDSIKEYRLYTLANGLTSLPITQSYSCLDDDGNLYISGQNGVSKVNINHFYDDYTKILTGIKTVLCDDKEIRPDKKGIYNIPSKCRRVQITPVALDYSFANPLVHVFLEGTDDAGITAKQKDLGSLEFTRLKHGDYNLHIQIEDSNTKEVISDEIFELKKAPHFLENIAVQILLLILIAAMVGIAVWRVMTGTVIRKQYIQIQEAKEEAERANRAKSRFLANISHEIRTPINTIMGMNEMILRENADNVPKQYFMTIINYAIDVRGATEALLELINDLLDISKIDSGKMHVVEQVYSIEDTLRTIIKMIRVRSEAEKLYFDIDVDEELPVKLYGDEAKIRQILLNLLTNAVKYTDEGGFKLKVRVLEKSEVSCKICFSVKDTGIGVRKEDLDKMFNAYERLDEEKNSNIQGTGLGLDISKQFAELMDGQLWCESTYGEGSEFFLIVTQKIVDSKEIGIFSEETDDSIKGPYVPKFVAPDADILVVDDNPMNLTVIKGLLKSTKVFVTTAESGEKCLKKLKTDSFNVVFLDHMMPGMDGLETIAEIRKTHPDLPVYALTANVTSGGEEFYKSKGFDGYLTKPIDTETLERVILRHLPEEIVMKVDDADEAAGEEELGEDMKWLFEIDGLTVNEGIKHSGGVALYISSLNMFLDTIDDNSKVIEDAYENGDIKLYTVKVHALKTSARIIGAMKLYKDCKLMEDAGNRRDMEYISANKDKLMMDYRSFREKLKGLRKDEDDNSDKSLIPEEELNDAYEALKELVPQMDYDSVEMILDQLNEYALPDGDDERIRELLRLLKLFDWDAMEQLLN